MSRRCIDYTIRPAFDCPYVPCARGTGQSNHIIWGNGSNWDRYANFFFSLNSIRLTSDSSVLGLIIGALFVTFTSWPWVFYFSSIVSGIIVLSIAVLVPNIRRYAPGEPRTTKLLRIKRLDLVGVAIMTGDSNRFYGLSGMSKKV